ncbi:hypothetical protein QTP88_009561 [Uroleucon formosanum]
MPQSSDGTNRAGQHQSVNKIKANNRDSAPGSGFQLVGKNGKPLKKQLSPVSPSLLQISNDPPTLNIASTAFNYVNTPLLTENLSGSMVIDESDNVNDHSNEHAIESTLPNDNVILNATSLPNNDENSLLYNKNFISPQQSFPPDYVGPIMVLAENTDTNQNVGKWHPLRAAKFFTNKFNGIVNIKPAGSKKIKISFDTIINGNLCLSSNQLNVNGFFVTIPSNFIFSYGIIKLENSISEKEFREGLQSPVPIAAFKRISIKKYDVIIQTRTVELKFVAPKIPSVISLFNMLYDVKPSIRSPVQCNQCLHFGHTQKYYRSNPRCSHCGESKHSMDSCSVIDATDPVCLFCKLPHLATDRRCREWLTQKEIKKIMATENISYKDALDFKKNNRYTSAFKFSDVVQNQPTISEMLKTNTPLHDENFPVLSQNHHFFNSKKSKRKTHPIPNNNQRFTHAEPFFSYPKGVEIISSDSQPPLGLWSCSIPNSSNIPTQLFQNICSMISKNSLLRGDFNSFHPAWGSNSMSHRGNLLYNTFNSFGLCLLNDGSPTHVGRPNSADSALDLSICSSDIFWNLSWCTLSEPRGSDHISIIIATNCSLTAKDRQNPSTDSSIPYYYGFNKANWPSFTLHIQDAVSSSLDAPTSTISYSALTNIINNAAISTIPIKKKKNLKSHPPSSPWWNAACSAAIKNRSSHFKAFRRSGCLTDLLKYRNVCAQTTRLLKTEKRKKWKSFCSNLNPSSSIQHLWSTARRFKNCLNPTKHPENDDWFDAFCSKVAPSYVPQETESQPIFFSFHSSPHVLTKSFNITKLNLAISSRKSIASGLDNISRILLKHVPTNALVSLLNIFNEILTTQ